MGAPLFPFGHGLTYSSFEYGDLIATTDADEFTLSIKVTNSGDVDSDEVIQLYMRDPFATIARPKRELRGFKRVHIPAGESRTVSFTLTPDQMAYYTARDGWIVEPGKIEFMVGASADDIRARAEVIIDQAYHTNVPASAIATRTHVE